MFFLVTITKPSPKIKRNIFLDVISRSSLDFHVNLAYILSYKSDRDKLNAAQKPYADNQRCPSGFDSKEDVRNQSIDKCGEA